MPLYHLVFLLLLFGVLIEYYKKKTPKLLFLFCFAVLTAMLCMRFGQGTDYYSYSLMYHTMPRTVAGVQSYAITKAEIGWRFLFMIFRIAGLSFTHFIFVLSMIQMGMLWRFISRYCKNGILALFLSYHTVYLTYFSSALRQGLVISVFLGILLQLLLDGKIVRYCIGVCACMLIHTVSLILLLPLVFRLIRFPFKHVVCVVLIGLAIGFVFTIVDIGLVLKRLVSIPYLEESSISVVSLLERVLSYIMVAYAFYLCTGGTEPDQKDPFFMIFKIYSLGVFMYGVLVWSPLISSRTIFVFKALEVAILSAGILQAKKARSLMLLFCIMLSLVMYVKNIGSYISQGSYQNTSVWNYPYVSILNPTEIAEYRGDTPKYIPYLEMD